MERRLRIVLTGMSTGDFHEVQKDVFEVASEADVQSARGPEALGAETQQVGQSMASGSMETLVSHWGASEYFRKNTQTLSLSNCLIGPIEAQ